MQLSEIDDSFFSLVRRPAASEAIETGSDQSGSSTLDAAATICDPEQEVDLTQQVSSPEESTTGMPHEARRALIYLMRQGTILVSENPQLFELLVRYEVAIRQHLATVYIQLILDARQGVAYIVNQETVTEREDTTDFPVLIRKRTLTLYDTLVLLILRKYYQERETAGEQKIIIDIEHIQTSLIPFIPLSNHDSKDRQKLNGILQKFSEKKILSVLRGEEGRYEITPIIRYVVNAEFLQGLLGEYEQLASSASRQAETTVKGNE